MADPSRGRNARGRSEAPRLQGNGAPVLGAILLLAPAFNQVPPLPVIASRKGSALEAPVIQLNVAPKAPPVPLLEAPPGVLTETRVGARHLAREVRPRGLPLARSGRARKRNRPLAYEIGLSRDFSRAEIHPGYYRRARLIRPSRGQRSSANLRRSDSYPWGSRSRNRRNLGRKSGWWCRHQKNLWLGRRKGGARHYRRKWLSAHIGRSLGHRC